MNRARRWAALALATVWPSFRRALVDILDREADGRRRQAACPRSDRGGCPLYRFGSCRWFDDPDCLERIEAEHEAGIYRHRMDRRTGRHE